MAVEDEIPQSLLAFARGERSRAVRLRESLTRIRDENPDPRVARGAADMLSGARTLREVVRDPSFSEAMGGATARLADQWRDLDPDERQRLMSQVAEAERALRVRLGLVPPDEG
jgi:hypothetical protein